MSMRAARIIPAAMVVVLTLGIGLWLVLRPSGTRPPVPVSAPVSQLAALRLGLIPERDVFAQRKRFRVLADYISKQIHRPVELATLNTYQAILQDFAEERIDGAFLGSLIAVLTVDRQGGQVLVQAQTPQGGTTYRGVIFVLDESPVRSVKDLRGRSITLLKTTTGGNLFPMVHMIHEGVLTATTSPSVLWAGTHDEVIQAVVHKRSDAGGVKDLRLDEFEKANPQVRIRRLAASAAVPDTVLVLHPRAAAAIGPRLSQVLLEMDRQPDGRAALAGFGAQRFLPCTLDDYRALYDMIDELGPHWQQLGINGAPPRRPAVLSTRAAP